MRFRSLLLTTLAAGAVFVVGCGSAAAGAQSAGEAGGITVTGLDSMRFNPETITVVSGQPVTLAFKNTGVLPHDLITEGAEKNARLVNVTSGREQKATFLANKPGTYNVVCSQPGHKEAGMVGKIVVSAG